MVRVEAAFFGAELVVEHAEGRDTRQLHEQVSENDAMLAAVVEMDLNLLGIVTPAAAAEELFALVCLRLVFVASLWEYLRVVADDVGVATLIFSGRLRRLLLVLLWLWQFFHTFYEEFLLDFHALNFDELLI